MSTLTIRKLDDDVKKRLQVRAAMNGRSMEAEVREILSEAVAHEESPDDISIGQVFEAFRRRTGGVDLEIPPRDDGHRPVPDFS